MNIENLYNKILLDARNPEIFSRFIEDSLNNKIIIFLTFLSKIFNKMDENDKNYQIFFDYIFHRIETDLRELGYGDMSVNKKMKVIVTKFYSILLDFKNFDNKDKLNKVEILVKYFKNIKEIDEFSAMINSYLSIDNSKLNDN
mgnify:CR=1 FL=1